VNVDNSRLPEDSQLKSDQMLRVKYRNGYAMMTASQKWHRYYCYY